MKKQGLFQGRFQPPTILHKQIIQDQQKENDIVVIQIIEGKESSKDKERNPFDYEYRKELLSSLQIEKPIIIIKYNNGYFPSIVNYFENEYIDDNSIEINNVYCGTDRVKQYNRQLKTTDDLTDEEKQRITIKEIERKSDSDEDVAQSKVRDQLLDKDYENLKKLLPEELHQRIEEMINKYSEQIKTQKEQNNLMESIMGL